MTEYVLLAAMAVVIVTLMFLRTNTAIGYLALCAGSVLLLSSGENVGLVASSLTSGLGSAAGIAKFILLFAPLVVCSVLLRGRMHGLALAVSFVPAVCIVLLGVVLLVPILSESTAAAVHATWIWDSLVQYQETFTAVGLVTSICLIAMTNKRPKDKHKKGHH